MSGTFYVYTYFYMIQEKSLDAHQMKNYHYHIDTIFKKANSELT